MRIRRTILDDVAPDPASASRPRTRAAVVAPVAAAVAIYGFDRRAGGQGGVGADVRNAGGVLVLLALVVVGLLALINA